MAPQSFVGGKDLQQLLADAVASFSPLATLVGSASARSLTQHVSNTKQTYAASIAPIGALGMMATVCKGTNLHGLKDMLGAGEADLFNTCAELGCGTLHGVVPHFSQRGGLTTEHQGSNRGVAACAILRAKWELGEADSNEKLDFDSVCRLLEDFSSGTISGRLVWDVKDMDTLQATATLVQQIMQKSWNGQDWNARLFHSIDSSTEILLKGGKGMIELHWPAPAMPLETNGFIVFLFIGCLALATLCVVIIATSPLLFWQSVAASTLLLGGQILLGGGHVAAQWIVKNQRVTVYIDIPRAGLAGTWMLVDNTWFTGRLARRPISYHSLTPNQTRIGQHLAMKGEYIPTLHALFVLTAIGVGFVAFYIGARSSHIYTILIYIFLFLIANMLKGTVVFEANKAYVTPLNNPGFRDVVKRLESPDQYQPPWSWPFRTLRNFRVKSTGSQDAYNSGRQSLPADSESRRCTDDVELLPISAISGDHPLPHYRVYAKFALRNIQAMGMFYFSHPQTWGMAAHVIFEALHGLVLWQPHMRCEPLLCLPFQFYDIRHQSTVGGANQPVTVSAQLVLAIDETRHEDIFWSAGMEFISILMGAFSDTTYLCSESEYATQVDLVGIYVYHVTKMILMASQSGEGGAEGDDGASGCPGVVSMMRAIDLVRGKYPSDSSESALAMMREQASAAVKSIVGDS